MQQLRGAGALPWRRWLAPMAAAILLVLGPTLIRPAMAQGTWKNWIRIQCSESGVSTTPMRSCYRGTVEHGNSGACSFNRYSAWAETPAETIYASALIVNGGGNGACYVDEDPQFRTVFPRSLPLLIEYSSNWSDLIRVGNTTGMYFDFPKRHCFAYYLPGRKWQAGYASLVRGFVCGAVGRAALTTAQIEEFTGSVRVRSQ